MKLIAYTNDADPSRYLNNHFEVFNLISNPTKMEKAPTTAYSKSPKNK